MVEQEPQSGDSTAADDRVAEINRTLASAGDLLGNVKTAIVPIDQFDLLEENARFMSNEMFQNLVRNIEKDGAVTSVPYCWQQPNGRYLVLSGNHRVKAGREAGRPYMLTLYNDGPMSEQERIAKQLSHNAIAGEDDPVVLKRLWNKIDKVELKYYAGLDDKTLRELEKINLDALSEVRLDFRTATFVFLPGEQQQIEASFKRAMEFCSERDLYGARFEDFDRMMDMLAKTQSAYNIRNIATALVLVLDLFSANQEALAPGWEWRSEEEAKQAQWVPLSSIFGTDRVPIEAARVLQQAVRMLQNQGEVEKKSLWRCIEMWAADWMSRQ